MNFVLGIKSDSSSIWKGSVISDSVFMWRMVSVPVIIKSTCWSARKNTEDALYPAVSNNSEQEKGQSPRGWCGLGSSPILMRGSNQSHGKLALYSQKWTFWREREQKTKKGGRERPSLSIEAEKGWEIPETLSSCLSTKVQQDIIWKKKKTHLSQWLCSSEPSSIDCALWEPRASIMGYMI